MKLKKRNNKLNPRVNYTQKYAIVDEETGEILERFRLVRTAYSMLKYYKDKYLLIKFKIVKI